MKKNITLINSRRNRRFNERSLKSKKHKVVHFILLAKVLPIHVVTGTIDFPTRIADRKERATEITTACRDNTWVTIAGEVIDTVNTTIKNYSFAEPSNRPGMFTLMNQAIQTQLLAPFQAAANADPINAITILESGSFNVKDQPVRKEQIFEGEAGIEPGSVDLTTPPGPNGDHLHQWYSSLDGISFTREQATNAAKTHLTGFISGKPAYFKEELSIKDVLQGMSQIIKIWVN